MPRTRAILTLLFSVCIAQEYEGLVLLKRYASLIESSSLCEKSRLLVKTPSIKYLPTNRDEDIVNFVLEANMSALVFDFESPSLGVGNCLLGYLQTFHWAVLSGLPLFIAKPDKGTANAICWFFDCGIPMIDTETLDKYRARRISGTSGKPNEFESIRSNPTKFIVVAHRSHSRVGDCLGDPLFRNEQCSPKKAIGTSVCWYTQAIKGLLPRLSTAAVNKIQTQLAGHFHGNFNELLSLIHSEQHSFSSLKETPLVWSALHVRTMHPHVEVYGKLKGEDTLLTFEQNMKLFINESDLCIFNQKHNFHPTSSSSLFIASDSLLFKTFLSYKWANHPIYKLQYFQVEAERLNEVTFSYNLKHSYHNIKPDSKDNVPLREVVLSIGQLVTLLEFWLLSRARPLTAIAFFDMRLGNYHLRNKETNGMTSSSSSSVSISFSSSSSSSSASDVKDVLRSRSTFASAAALLGGLDSIGNLSICSSIGTAIPPKRMGKQVVGTCSSECRGREVVFSL